MNVLCRGAAQVTYKADAFYDETADNLLFSSLCPLPPLSPYSVGECRLASLLQRGEVEFPHNSHVSKLPPLFPLLSSSPFFRQLSSHIA